MGLKPFEKKIWLSSPTMHGEELEYVRHAIETNWVSTVGENINELERMTAELCGTRYAVALASGTSALHLSMRLAGESIYGAGTYGALRGKKVFCTDMTFDASVNPVVYEGGVPVFIDSERETWNMDPAALEKAFELYPEVRVVVLAHLYGTPAKMDEIRAICDRRGAIIVEDAAEAMGAGYKGSPCGSNEGSYPGLLHPLHWQVTLAAPGKSIFPPYPQANCPKTPDRSPKPWILLNPIYTIFFLYT